MSEIKSLYIYIQPDDITIDYNPIKINTKLLEYVYISIIANDTFTDINKINYMYKTLNNTFNYDEKNVNLSILLNRIGKNLLEILRNDFTMRSEEELNSLYFNSPYPGNINPSSLQKYINTVVGTLVLAHFNLLIISMNDNFKTYSHYNPLKNIKLAQLSQNIYIYSSYLVDYLNIIDNSSILHTWLKEIDARWKIFNDIVIAGDKYDYNQAILTSIHGYAQYIKNKTNININEKEKSIYNNNIIISSITLNKMSEIYTKYKNELDELKNEYSNDLLEEFDKIRNDIKEQIEGIDEVLEKKMDDKLKVFNSKMNKEFTYFDEKIKDVIEESIKNNEKYILDRFSDKIDFYIDQRLHEINIHNIVKEYLELHDN